MANAVFEAGRASLEFARRLTLGLFDGFKDDLWFHQPFPGANHALWTLGHITWADDEFLEKLAGKPAKLPKEWWDLFAMGSTLHEDRAAYPKPEALLEAAGELREELLAWFGSMDEAKLASEPPDDWKSFAPTYGALMPGIAWHEGFHSGQLSVIRKSLGMEKKFG